MRWIIYLLLPFSLGLGLTHSYADKNDTGPKVGTDAPDFTLEDANGQKYTLKNVSSQLATRPNTDGRTHRAHKGMRGKTVLLIMGNRKIQKEDDKWAAAFRKDFGTNKAVVAYIVADMRSVPGFIPKRFIKSQLRKNKPPVTLLLDWKGKVHQAYHTQKQKPNLYLINPKGKIAFHIKANFDKKSYGQLKEAVNEIQQSLPVKEKSLSQQDTTEKKP